MRVAINRFEPFRELAAVQARLNRIFNEPYEPGDDTLTRADWAPAVDVYETEQHELVLKAELPGIKREDIDLKVENSVLTIRGERKRDQEIKQDAYQRVERTYGAFARSFTRSIASATPHAWFASIISVRSGPLSSRTSPTRRSSSAGTPPTFPLKCVHPSASAWRTSDLIPSSE